jgi:oligo-alginate lyase
MQLPSPLPAHPRLLLREGDWTRLRRKIDTDGPSAALYRTLQYRADVILTEPPVAREMTGRMLLMISRQALERICVLSMVAGVSKDARYGARAIAELVAVCRFADWNPSHFLDTAELCLAVAIGFDWLHHQLSPAQRDEIATALIEKGIKPSLDPTERSNWWLTTDENWAQVCHGGLGAAAIALADRDPELARLVLTRAIAAIPAVAASYAPDGAYPEGPMYWSYGTGYHVVLAAALKSLTGSAQGLDAFPGFAESAQYINAMTAPSGEYFNYSDCAARRRIQAQLFWMADHYGHPEWLAYDLATLERDLEEYRRNPPDQYWYYDMVALALLWRVPAAATSTGSQSFWSGGGTMPVATYRWGDRGFFLGVKGGAVGLSHSHMDVGSFVFEAAGERWAVDTGMQDYAGLEAAGVDLWNEREQDSQRWSIFRIGPESHNILRLGDKPQLLFKHAQLTADASSCSVDLSALYGDPVTAARRRFELHPNGFSIEDSWTADVAVPMASQWLTTAEVDRDNHSVRLHQNGRHLRLEVDASIPLSIVVQDFVQPGQPFDAPNPGLKRISFVCSASMAGSLRVRAVSADV